MIARTATRFLRRSAHECADCGHVFAAGDIVYRRWRGGQFDGGRVLRAFCEVYVKREAPVLVGESAEPVPCAGGCGVPSRTRTGGRSRRARRDARRSPPPSAGAVSERLGSAIIAGERSSPPAPTLATAAQAPVVSRPTAKRASSGEAGGSVTIPPRRSRRLRSLPHDAR